MTFEKCCGKANKVMFDTYHNPKPMDWPKEVNEAISSLLWYIPNIDSVQSYKDELIENMVYDNLTFEYICSSLGMSKNDFLFLDRKDIIPDATWDYYHDSICINCQKAILTKYQSHTKTKTLLRCIRNAVAHGDFTVVDDIFIGFNVNNKGENKAIIKIKYERLRNSLQRIRNAYSKEIIIANALKKLGYETITNQPRYIINDKVFYPDIIAKKNDETFIFEIKVISKESYLSKPTLDRYLSQIMLYKQYLEINNVKFVLVFDTSRLTKLTKEYLSTIKEVIVMDINEIIKLSYGEDVLIEELY